MHMTMSAPPALARPSTLAEAVELLASGAHEAQAIAGGTWVMRAPVRGEPLGRRYVSLAGVPELTRMELGPPLRIGAAVTHAGLAAALDGRTAFAGLRAAAGGSANPAVRAVATVGGNLAAAGFPAADLVPALLALDADVELSGAGGAATVPLTGFLLGRKAAAAAGILVTAVTVARAPARSAHARLTLRSAGDYPVAIVSVARDEDRDGGGLRVAVGSVEQVAHRWPELEAELSGRLDADAAAAAAERLSSGIDARDGVEAPAWYRRRVLPSLVRQACTQLTEPAHDPAVATDGPTPEEQP